MEHEEGGSSTTPTEGRVSQERLEGRSSEANREQAERTLSTSRMVNEEVVGSYSFPLASTSHVDRPLARQP
jgi:hypothetical protein